ncbi:MAG: hypothetical protein GX802_07520 [Clostridiales bacterium]|nr:hypothetical protein [Clostridiales bacterium]
MSSNSCLTACYIFNIFDLIITLFWVQLLGLQAEANPFGKMLLLNPSVAVVVKTLGVGLALLILYIMRNRKIANFGINVVLVAYSALAVYHVFLIAVSV